MKLAFVLSILALPTLVVGQSSSKFKIEPSSSFVLSGVSNVNEFDCELKQGFCEDQLKVDYAQKGNQVFFKNASLNLSVSKFDCKSKFITRDMKKTLKEEEFPFMEFELISIGNIDIDNDYCAVAEALVTISGHTNRYQLKYEIKAVSDTTFQIKMSSDFKMKDFQIDPPSAMMGLIKVQDTINVAIDLQITML